MLDILIVDDDQAIVSALNEMLTKRGASVRAASSLAGAKEELSKKIPDGLLVDLVLPDGSGLDLTRFLQREATQYIIMTGHPSLNSAIEGVRNNADDYLIKPIELNRLKIWLDGLVSNEDKESAGAANSQNHFSGMIGHSIALQRVQKLIEKVAPSNISVLLQGESGTGKEVAARMIHQLSPHHDKPMLSLNCGSANENLIADELFGHERGGFTGANRQHRGYFERAHGTTLFLDEITEMPIDLQAHLLRVLETGKFVRIGGDKEIKTNVRLVAATNRDPHEAIAAGKLREDLYFRLAVFPIRLPALRERREDIPDLVKYFVDVFNQTMNMDKTIDLETILYLESLSWPGNIRQLKNSVQRAHLLADKEIQSIHFDLDEHASALFPPVNVKKDQEQISIDQVERRLILSKLEEYNGNKKQAAEALGISLKTIYNKLKKYQAEA